MKHRLTISNDSLRWLRGAFQELPRQIENFVRYHRPDSKQGDYGELPYNNNETASVSMVVAAAARAGYIALADYRTDKRKNGKGINGRCDLYVARGENCLELESKQIHLTPRSPKEKLASAFRKAERDAKCILDKPRAAAVFALMNIAAKEQDDWAAAFEDTYDGVHADLKWCWYDPKPDYKHRWQERLHPGIFMFIQLV
jgi:hypothetical protein